MLQQQQAVIDQLVDRRVGNYAYDAAHGMSFKGTKFVMAAGACEGVPERNVFGAYAMSRGDAQQRCRKRQPVYAGVLLGFSNRSPVRQT
jgi:hypothetical protein